MSFNIDGTFSLTQQFGTGTPPSNEFPPQVGAVLDNIASSLNLNSLGPAISPYVVASLNLSSLGTAVSPYIVPSLVPALPAFCVTKGGTDQTVTANTFTVVTWSTEVYDVGSRFASNVWTPPAGKVHLDAGIYIPPGAAATVIAIQISKNGGTLRQVNYAGIVGQGSALVALDDTCTGTDTYGVNAYRDVGTIISGLTTLTWFNGHWISS